MAVVMRVSTMVIVLMVMFTIMIMMLVAVIMSVTAAMAVMRMIVCAVLVRMIVRVVVTMRRLGIGAAFRIERRFDLDHACAEPLHHPLDDMVATDAQSLGHNLRRQMAIAEMPGEPHQMLRIGGTNLQQRLRCCDDLDQATVFEHQCIAAAQGDGALQIQQELEPAGAGHCRPPPVTVVEIEHDSIGSGFAPVVLAQNACGSDHAENLIRPYSA